MKVHDHHLYTAVIIKHLFPAITQVYQILWSHQFYHGSQINWDRVNKDTPSEFSFLFKRTYWAPALCWQGPPHGNKFKNKVDRVSTVMEERQSFSIQKCSSIIDIHKNHYTTGIFNLDQRFRTSFQEGRLCMNRSRESILRRGNVYEKDQDWQRVWSRGTERRLLWLKPNSWKGRQILAETSEVGAFAQIMRIGIYNV